MILWLGGVDLCRIEVNGWHYYSCDGDRNGFDSFKVTASTLSETKQVNAIAVTRGDMQNPITLCDTPGAFENRAVEIDVANGIGTANAMRKSRSLRFVVVISKGTFGDALNEFQQFGVMMTKMVRPLSKHKASLQYLFTKFPPSDSGNIHNKLVQFKEQHIANLRHNKELLELLDDMIEKTTNGAVIMDPLDRIQSLNFLSSVYTLPRVLEPDSVINNFLSDVSLQVVKDQITMHTSSIKHLFRRNNFDLASHKLRELQNMASYLNVSTVDTAVNSVVMDFCKLLWSLETSYLVNRKHILDHNGTVKMTADAVQEFSSVAVRLYDMGGVYTAYRRLECRSRSESDIGN